MVSNAHGGRARGQGSSLHFILAILPDDHPQLEVFDQLRSDRGSRGVLVERGHLLRDPELEGRGCAAGGLWAPGALLNERWRQPGRIWGADG